MAQVCWGSYLLGRVWKGCRMQRWDAAGCARVWQGVSNRAVCFFKFTWPCSLLVWDMAQTHELHQIGITLLISEINPESPRRPRWPGKIADDQCSISFPHCPFQSCGFFKTTARSKIHTQIPLGSWFKDIPWAKKEHCLLYRIHWISWPIYMTWACQVHAW